jgi:CCR4-NOT transcription complex subunit 9
MERGSELSKTVACFIVQRILLDDNGLKYICEKNERLNAINTVLGFMIKNKPSPRLVKHIIRSYSRLAENQEGRNTLNRSLPEEMKTEEFYNNLDESSKKWLQNLMKLLRGDSKMGNNNQNGNFGVNNINININMNNNMNMGMPMDMNNNGNMNNNLNIPPNMMILNQMNLQPNQGYMMPQQTNIGDFNFPIYNENYLNNIYMGNQGTSNGFNNMNYYGNYQK